jgi:sarcosine oxidase
MPHDVVVVGAGVFGAWTACELRRAGRSVLLLDAHGPAGSLSSSGGESRIARMGYGADEIYTRWSLNALNRWKALGGNLFIETGVLWLMRDNDPLVSATIETLRRVGIAHERLTRDALARRYPQMRLDDIAGGVLEPASGVLMARRAVQTVVQVAMAEGVRYVTADVMPPSRSGRLAAVEARDGKRFSAATFVFACGPWLPKLFPALLGTRIFPTRQEVFFFAPPAGDVRFTTPAMPAWIDFAEGVYGLPDLEARGFKLAIDTHGPPIDPDTAERRVSDEGLRDARRALARRFPILEKAALVESRVCQYENTSSGDFLIDRHPDFENVWIAGGGSGHGFKHGPSVGEHVAALLDGRASLEPRFSLALKKTMQHRAVF